MSNLLPNTAITFKGVELAELKLGNQKEIDGYQMYWLNKYVYCKLHLLLEKENLFFQMKWSSISFEHIKKVNWKKYIHEQSQNYF